MAIIDPEGLFNGDRLRRCSCQAQLHFPRLLLASDGFARIEINYARIVGRAYPTFNPVPSSTELQSFIQEYAKNYLLFIYQVDGQLWGQWDTNPKFLPKYKTSMDRRSPIPPEPGFTEWKRRYRAECKAFQKSFQNIPEEFLHGGGVGVGVGVGKNICASKTDARVGELPSIDNPPFESLPEPELLKSTEALVQKRSRSAAANSEQDSRFGAFWGEYWLRKAKRDARRAFDKHVTTSARFEQILAAVRSQKPEMLNRAPEKRPYAASWLNGERWEDELAPAEPSTPQAANFGSTPAAQQMLSRYIPR